MTTTNDRRFRTLTAAALTLACLFLTPTTGQAELRTRKALMPRAVPAPALPNLPRLLVVKGSPTSPALLPGLVPNLPKPLKLTDQFKQALLSQAGQPAAQPATPVALSVNKPSVPGLARLFLRNPQTVSAGTATCPDGFAAFTSQNGVPSIAPTARTASLFLSPPAAGKRYLVDFQVIGGTSYALNSGPGSTQTFTGTEHLVTLFEATGTSTAILSISGVTKEPAGVWYLRGCEITPLN